MLSISITPEIEELLRANAPVAVGVSGGKDSQAAAIAVAHHLNTIGHTGPRILIHSDLGRVEWKASLHICEVLAAHLGWELITVRRAAGDLMDRWLTRWANNVERYADLSCVKLILPWSTPSMRFCTSELKTAVIASALRKRWPNGPIISAAGIRAEESPARSKMPVSAPHSKLTRANSPGISWHPIIGWRLPQVLKAIEQAGIDLHPAYTSHGASRVSCCFCIMSSAADLLAAAGAAENADLYREMVKLELDSTFAFQGTRWLADVAPHLLPDDERARIPGAKLRAGRRVAAEACIPPELLYVKGWPTFVPDIKQAALIAAVRRDVASAVGLQIGFTDAGSVQARYQDLFNARAKREAA
jgi:3'-phosphoadenosine 5'-phosphosulfate sulfotransferase (PAPS reductase)/FAD synthetase